jgi:hypothetical protein
MSIQRFQPRYDETNGVYRDCKWCYGRGCLQCHGEAKKAYKKAFPDGPQPVATYEHDGSEEGLKNALVAALAKEYGGSEEELENALVAALAKARGEA